MRHDPSPAGPARARNEDPGRLRRAWRSPRLRLALLGIVVLAGSVAGIVLGGGAEGGVREAIDAAGPAAPVAFVVLYVVLTILFFPGAIVTAAGGAAFGVVLGTLLTVIGATIGAVGAFVIGRRLGREQVEQIAGRRIGGIDRWLSRHGFLAVLYVRLVPVFPFNALNYAAGVTSVRVRHYVGGTALGIVPGAFAFAALGSSLGDPWSPEFIGAVALVAVLAVGAPLVQRILRSRGRGAPADG